MRKVWLWSSLVLWVAVLSCNGLVCAVALYSEWAALPRAWGTGRPLLEQAAFVRDARLGWRLQPNLEVAVTDEATGRDELFLTTTVDGLRTTPRNGTGPEVVLLGDSQTQGYFLYDEETVAARLAARTGLRVVNGGVGGYSTDQQYLLLQELLQDRAPAWVVVVFFVNDLIFLDRGQAWDMAKPYFAAVDGRLDFTAVRFAPGPDSLPAPDFARREVFCCRRGFFARVHYGLGRSYGALPAPGAVLDELARQVGATKPGAYDYNFIPGRTDFYADPGRYESQWSAFFQILARMHQQGHQRGFGVSAVYLPEIAQIARPELDHFAPQRYFADTCGRLGLDCVEPHGEFVARQRRTPLYFMDDGHLAPAGADLLAEIIQRHLARAGVPVNL